MLTLLKRNARFISLLIAAVYLALAIPAMAQTLAAPETTGAKIWKIVLMVLTAAGSTLSPYLTKYLVIGVLWVMDKAKANVPAPVLLTLSTILSGVYAGVMGEFTAMPLNTDSALAMGGVVGLAAQKLANERAVALAPNAQSVKPMTPEQAQEMKKVD